MNKRIGIVALLAGFLLYVPAVLAQNKYEFTFGNYVVYYNTFPSTFLDNGIAKSAGIKRSRGRGVITVVVRQHQKEGADKPVKATVSGSAANLIGQVNKLKMKEIRSGDAIYYVAEYPIFNNEQITFNLSVMPEGETLSQDFNFTRDF